MATVELCEGSQLGTGFQLLIGLAEIHVPRMWVEENDKGHHVRLSYLVVCLHVTPPSLPLLPPSLTRHAC